MNMDYKSDQAIFLRWCDFWQNGRVKHASPRTIPGYWAVKRLPRELRAWFCNLPNPYGLTWDELKILAQELSTEERVRQ